MVWCGYFICYSSVISITLTAIHARDNETLPMKSLDAVCRPGSYGMNCSQQCGHCLSSRCNPVTGGCPKGCQVSWVGALCRTHCIRGYCNASCGNCLGGAMACDVTRGVCQSGCLPGWTGLDCNISCPAGLYGIGCRTVCGLCKGGVQFCDQAVPICRNGCERGFTGALCNTVQEDCPDLRCRCGHCFKGRSLCHVLSGVCLGGCETNYSGKSCQLDCPKSRFGNRCQYKCDQCLCGCNSLTGSCLRCRSFMLNSPRSTPDGARVRSGRKGEGRGSWAWIMLSSTALSAVVLVPLFYVSWAYSKLTRRMYVLSVFNQLTADDTFRFLNPPLVRRSRRVKEPQFDVKQLSRKDREDVIRELDCLLGDHENYEDFVRSPRYRELRVGVANKAWATDRGRSMLDKAANFDEATFQNASARVSQVTQRWKLLLCKSLGSPVDSRRGCGPAIGILKDTSLSISASAQDDASPAAAPVNLAVPRSRQAPGSVRFSQAASLVIYPAASPSASSSSLRHDHGVLNSVSHTFSSFVSSSPPPSPSSHPASSPSSVDLSIASDQPPPADPDSNGNSDIRHGGAGSKSNNKIDLEKLWRSLEEKRISQSASKKSSKLCQGTCFRFFRRTLDVVKRIQTSNDASEHETTVDNDSSVRDLGSEPYLLPEMYTNSPKDSLSGEAVWTRDRLPPTETRIRARDSIFVTKFARREEISTPRPSPNISDSEEDHDIVPLNVKLSFSTDSVQIIRATFSDRSSSL